MTRTAPLREFSDVNPAPSLWWLMRSNTGTRLTSALPSASPQSAQPHGAAKATIATRARARTRTSHACVCGCAVGGPEAVQTPPLPPSVRTEAKQQAPGLQDCPCPKELPLPQLPLGRRVGPEQLRVLQEHCGTGAGSTQVAWGGARGTHPGGTNARTHEARERSAAPDRSFSLRWRISTVGTLFTGSNVP